MVHVLGKLTATVCFVLALCVSLRQARCCLSASSSALSPSLCTSDLHVCRTCTVSHGSPSRVTDCRMGSRNAPEKIESSHNLCHRCLARLLPIRGICSYRKSWWMRFDRMDRAETGRSKTSRGFGIECGPGRLCEGEPRLPHAEAGT